MVPSTLACRTGSRSAYCCHRSQNFKNFTPSNRPTGIQKPSAIVSVHAVDAETEKEALLQIAPVQLMYRYLAQGITDIVLPKPEDAIKQLGALPARQPYEKGSGIPPRFIAGTPDQVHEDLTALAKDLSVEEVIIQDMMTDHEAGLRSYDLIAEVFELEPR